MAALAVSDSLAAFLFLPRHWLRLLLRHIGWPDVTPFDGSVHACLTLTYAARTCQFISAWLLVAMTTERLVATLRARQLALAKPPARVGQTDDCHGYHNWPAR
jgi:hypothetical protein